MAAEAVKFNSCTNFHHLFGMSSPT